MPVVLELVEHQGSQEGREIDDGGQKELAGIGSGFGAGANPLP